MDERNEWTSFAKEAAKRKRAGGYEGSDRKEDEILSRIKNNPDAFSMQLEPDVVKEEEENVFLFSLKEEKSKSKHEPAIYLPLIEKTPAKSCLKKSTQNVKSTDSNVYFNFGVSSDEDDKESVDSAADLHNEYLCILNGEYAGDFRRLFSMKPEERKAFKSRKTELGPFFPPKHPDETSAATRIELSTKQRDVWMKMVWENSYSASKTFKFLAAVRVKIDSDALIRQYNQPAPVQFSSEIIPTPTERRCSKSNKTAPRRIDPNAFGLPKRPRLNNYGSK